jgi:hypothetical protein
MRKMKKFSAGGAQGRYDRRMADIDKDYAKASKGKTGRAAEIAAAKRDQRIADAKDDLAKRTGADRTQTRAAEKSAERNLTMTRKYGAMKSAVKADDVAKVSSTDDVLKSVPKPQMAAKPAVKSASAPARTSATSSAPTTNTRAQRELQRTAARSQKAIREKRAENQADFRKRVQNGMIKADAGKADAGKPSTSRMDAAGRGLTGSERSSARMGAALSYLNPFSYLENRASRLDPSEVNKAGGGTVKKKPTPPKPTPEEIAASKRQNKSLGNIKPGEVSKGDAGAIGRGNRSSGMKAGGKAKMADKAGRALKKKSADTMGRAMMKKAGGGKCYAKGGSVSARADGCATKGKTKGKMV